MTNHELILKLEPLREREAGGGDANGLRAVVALVSDHSGIKPVIGFVAKSYEELQMSTAKVLPLAIPGESEVIAVPFENIINFHALSSIELACEVLSQFVHDIDDPKSICEAAKVYLHNSVGKVGMPYHVALKLLVPSDEVLRNTIWEDTYQRGLASKKWTVNVNNREMGMRVNAELYIPSYGPTSLAIGMKRLGVHMDTCSFVYQAIMNAQDWNDIPWARIAEESGKEIDVVVYRNDPHSAIGMSVHENASFAPKG